MPTTQTLYPNGTVSAPGVIIGGGAASVHAALGDASDSTWIDLAAAGGTPAIVQMDDITIAAGHMIKQVWIQSRVAALDAGGTEYLVYTQRWRTGSNQVDYNVYAKGFSS